MYKIVLIFFLNISTLYSFDLNSLVKSANEYANQGKLLVLGESLKTAMNNSLDTNTTKVKELIIDTDNSIKMVVKLTGEDKDFILDIKHFDWSISKDKKLIVFENIEYSGNIKWIEYLLTYYFDITKGYITVKYSSGVKTILSTLKEPIKPTYKTDVAYSKEFWTNLEESLTSKWVASDKKDLTNLFNPIFDKQYININSLYIQDKKIYLNATTKGSKKGVNFFIDDFIWRVQNNKYIIIENIKLKDSKKPWIVGSLKKRKNSIKFQYSNFIEEILKSIKPQKGEKDEIK